MQILTKTFRQDFGTILANDGSEFVFILDGAKVGGSISIGGLNQPATGVVQGLHYIVVDTEVTVVLFNATSSDIVCGTADITITVIMEE